MKVKAAKVVMKMYKWLKEYLVAFGKDFPFSKVADLNEYEIIRIIQYCIKTNTEYNGDTEEDITEAVVGEAKVNKSKIGKGE